MIALPLAPEQLPDRGREVVITTVVVYILLTAVCLAKGKVFTCMIGLFVPPVVVYGAIRLARPDSPWARMLYGAEKRARTRRRYRATKVRERRRQQLLDVLERVDSQIEHAPAPEASAAPCAAELGYNWRG